MEQNETLSIEVLLLIGTLGMVFLTLFIIFFIIVYQRRLYAEKEKQRIQEQIHQKALFRAGFESQELERKRIAQDLHDEVGANLSTLNLYTSLLKPPKEGASEQAQEAFKKSKALIGDTLQMVRNISKMISPMALEKFGLKKSVERLTEGVNLSENIQCKAKIADNFPLLDTALELSIYRIAQELISNALKYAQATRITLHIYIEEDRIHFTYKDDGIGFDLEEAQNRLNVYSSGLGLKNIESRVNGFDGKFKVLTAPNQGTRYEISFPIVFLRKEESPQEITHSNGVATS